MRRNDQAGGDLNRGLAAETVDQHQLAVVRAQSGVDRLEARERPGGDGDLGARREDPPGPRRAGRQTDNPVGVGSRDELGDFGVRSPGRRGAEFSPASDAHAELYGAPAKTLSGHRGSRRGRSLLGAKSLFPDDHCRAGVRPEQKLLPAFRRSPRR